MSTPAPAQAHPPRAAIAVDARNCAVYQKSAEAVHERALGDFSAGQASGNTNSLGYKLDNVISRFVNADMNPLHVMDPR